MPDRLAPANPITLSDRFAEDDPDRSRDLTDHQIRILDAAAEEFLHAGFDATSVDSIARRLGQTKGFIYYHFRSKLDIFHAVYERGMLMVRESVAPHFEADAPGVSGAGEGAARLAAMAEAHLANLLERTAYHDAMRQGLERLRGLKPTDPRHRTVRRLNALRDEYEGQTPDSGQQEDPHSRVYLQRQVGSVRLLPATSAG
jgi:AcrR family transcriptional regulator